MTELNVDFGATARDYACHRAGFPDSLFHRLARFGVGLPGQVVVDLGTGTGTLGRGFARRHCQVIGVDRSSRLLAEARRLDREAEVAVDYVVALAEAVSLPAAGADVVAAGQCWHWFDRPRAALECARLLRPQGLMLIAHFDWLPLAGNVVEATERLILAHNPAWHMAGGSGLYPEWLRDLRQAGFHSVESFSYDVDVPYSHDDWRGRIRASAGVGASLSPDAVAAFDREHAALLRARFPGPVLAVPHRVFAVVARPPASAAGRRS